MLDFRAVLRRFGKARRESSNQGQMSKKSSTLPWTASVFLPHSVIVWKHQHKCNDGYQSITLRLASIMLSTIDLRGAFS